MSEIYQNNLEALKEIKSPLYDKISKIESNSGYEVFIGDDSANINIVDKQDNTPFYKTKPLDEVLKVFESYKKYKRYPYLYFFGLGNGVLYKLLLENEVLKRAFVIEPNAEMVYVVLNLIDFSKEIREERLVIVLQEEVTYRTLISHLDNDSKIFAKTYELLIPFEYYDKYMDDIIKINKIFTKALEQLVYSFGNDIKDTLIGVEHFVANLPKTIKTPKLKTFLNGVKKAKTAIIVSTGPSLSKQIEKLKSIQDKVIIFCIDASFPILHKHGIKPDIVVSIERIALTSTFYKKTPSEFHKDIVFAVSNIAHKELLESIKGGELVLMSRPFGYKFFFDFVDWGYVGKGMSAANLAYELCAMSLFEQIVFIGQDLAYGSDGTSHASEHVLGKDEVKKEKAVAEVEAYGGNGVVKTTLVWKLFLNFFEADIADTDKAGYSKTINATEGGARIHGAIEMPFSEVIEKYIKDEPKKGKIELKKPEAKEIAKNTQKIKNKIKKANKMGKKVKKIAEETFLHVAEFLKEVENLKKKNRLQDVNYDRAKELIDEIDELKEMVNEFMFHKMFFDVMQAYILHLELELACIQVKESNSDDDKKLKMIEWLYAHKKWLFSMAGILDATLEAIHKGVKQQK